MADDKGTKAQPVKATMAPAARQPGGADDPADTPAGRSAEAKADRTDDARVLEHMSDERFAEIEAAVRTERARRGRQPHMPSYGLSEGERADLEQRGETTSPWTGEKITGDGAPRTKRDD